MSLYGYTTGSMNNKVFTWARNVTNRSHSQKALSLHNHAVCSAHTLIWNIIKKKAPSIIVQKMETGMDGLPGLDWSMKGLPVDPVVSLNIEGQDHEISGLVLGPPSGLCSTRYARACHKETSKDTEPWVLSLTTRRDEGSSIEGGNFYLAEYGVLIKNAANTFIAHKNNQYHGTTPLDIDWSDKNIAFESRGFSLLIPQYLRKVWKEYEKTQETVEGVDILLPACDGADSEDSESTESEDEAPVLENNEDTRPKNLKRKRDDTEDSDSLM